MIYAEACGEEGWGALAELEGKSRPFGGEVQRGPVQSTQPLHQRFWSVSPEYRKGLKVLCKAGDLLRVVLGDHSDSSVEMD